MFTGIITNLGKISKKGANRLSVKANKELLGKLSNGLSIAVDGICFTITSKSGDVFNIDFMPETEARTNIKYLKGGSLVNLELPATPNTFFSGHIVQGHIDAVAKLEDITKEENTYILKFTIHDSFFKYIVTKGSVAVNGISLTAINSGKKYFTVGIIPYTWENTTLHTLKLGDFVNVEVDILAKYLERLIKK